jgi:hypothetical protein
LHAAYWQGFLRHPENALFCIATLLQKLQVLFKHSRALCPNLKIPIWFNKEKSQEAKFVLKSELEVEPNALSCWSLTKLLYSGSVMILHMKSAKTFFNRKIRHESYRIKARAIIIIKELSLSVFLNAVYNVFLCCNKLLVD